MNPAWLAAGVAALVAAAGVAVPLIGAATGASACLPGTVNVTGQVPPQAGLDADQAANAAVIVSVSVERRLPVRAAVIAIATAMQESNLYNLDHGDLDSLGLFQQRPSQGWGTPAQVMDPRYSAGIFYDRLVQVQNWATRRLSDAAWQVQRYAVQYASLYDEKEAAATAVVAGLLAPATGTASAPGRTGDGPAAVFVVGDSITLAATDAITEQLPGWTVTVDAQVSRPTAAGVSILRHSAAAAAAGIWVVALGTNDRGATQAQYAGYVEQVLAAADGRRVVWTTAYGTGVYRGDYVGVNAAVAAAAGAGGVEVADWAGVIALPGNAGHLPADDVHPDATGSRLFAATIASVVTGTGARTPVPAAGCDPGAYAAAGAGSEYAAAAAVAIAAAMDQLGEPYTYDAHPPDSWDCSKLTAWVWGQAGATLTAYSFTQAEQTDRICTGVSDCRRPGVLLPGDLLFYFAGAHHVALYLGDGQLIEASSPATGVRVTDAWNPWASAHFTAAGRVRGFSLTPAAALGDRVFPVLGSSRSSTPWGVRGGTWAAGRHTGVDFSAATGDTIVAAAAGTVVSVAVDGDGYGRFVVITHPDGRRSLYAHLSSQLVRVGSEVSAGQAIGRAGATGNAPGGPHLHFEVRQAPYRYGDDVDPLAWLGSATVALHPTRVAVAT